MSETTTYNQPITRSCVTTKLDGSPLLIIFVFFKKKHADPSRSFAACDYEAKFTPTANYNALVRATRLWVSAWENDRAVSMLHTLTRLVMMTSRIKRLALSPCADVTSPSAAGHL